MPRTSWTAGSFGSIGIGSEPTEAHTVHHEDVATLRNGA
jgi:hypothetical protein